MLSLPTNDQRGSKPIKDLGAGKTSKRLDAKLSSSTSKSLGMILVSTNGCPKITTRLFRLSSSKTSSMGAKRFSQPSSERSLKPTRLTLAGPTSHRLPSTSSPTNIKPRNGLTGPQSMTSMANTSSVRPSREALTM
jgi:hypothetical protein